MAKVIVTTLGTGDAFGSFGRAYSGILLQAAGRRWLIDPGPAILPQLHKAGVSAATIDAVLITHLHGDHTAGLPFLLLDCQFSSKRKRRLMVAGPRGSSRRLPSLVTACYRELSPANLSFSVAYREISAGDQFAMSRAKVTAFKMKHGRAGDCLGYRIQIGGKIVCVTGDTAWCDALVELADGADLLLIEATNFCTITTGHLSYREIVQHAASLRSRRIVLTHVGEELLRNAAKVHLPIARDGGKIKL